MVVRTPAIVLSGIKYGESNLILRALTRESGLKSYWVPGVFGSGKRRLRSSLFQPLTVLEIEGYHRNKGTLEHIREARALFQGHNIAVDVRKIACALFISEILGATLGGEQRDEALFDFVERSVHWLDGEQFCPLFPAYFLWNLTAYLGFFPDTSGRGLPLFDLKEGTFVRSGNPLYCMDDEDVNLFLSLTESRLGDIPGIKFSRGQPKAQLLWSLKYFEHQVQGFRGPQSLAVLNTVFTR